MPFQTLPVTLPGSAGPRSLATTSGVSIDFLSSGYLDVSVPRVRSKTPMYSGLKYLSQPIISCRSNYNELSGGFPHSDIHGSKPIPGSPWLNAGYHVLHRLLLPRHPPNALFALDLIQKEQDPHPQAGDGLLFPVVAAWNGNVSKAVLTRITDWFVR